ncbi:hypothetical protein KIN20_021432 [Parelaphostrongylus tenuis]|uniref:Secreted protein n=1 Tax=Parelaphostrongylus tenuis TaxID=148309 RepID=A0AAD5QRL1_PARTN|nr:hypothetical protein KIN20_021432 [Parelaphostrongylus tenuis]
MATFVLVRKLTLLCGPMFGFCYKARKSPAVANFHEMASDGATAVSKCLPKLIGHSSTNHG